MKKIFSFLLLALVAASMMAAPKQKYVDAANLTLVGKLMPGATEYLYHRIDTTKYKGFDAKENLEVRESAGMSIAFKTNSKVISVKPKYGEVEWPQNSTGIAAHGFDLYIKDANGKWLWAGSCARGQQDLEKAQNIITDMDGTEHECLLYLPLFAELKSLEIGVEEGANIEKIDNPFRHRIVIHGSSYTHGTSTSRAGMAYPAQFCRATGLQLLPLGCSGHCKLQPYFANALADVQAEAFIFDSFSNPKPEEIKKNLFPFIEKVQSTHPGVPLIFQSTIRREKRNFNTAVEKYEADRAALVDELMAEACKKYKDVYYIHPNATPESHEATVDGIHPDNYGYTLWMNSVKTQVLEILAKYGIK